MAEIEKLFLDQTGAEYLVEKLGTREDTKDAATLKSAKDYADGLAENYDPVGTAQTKVAELANGQVKTNKEAIEKLNGADTVEGSVAKQIKDLKTTLEGEITDSQYDDSELAGRVTAVEGDITTLKGTGDGSVKKAVEDAKSEVEGKIGTLENLTTTAKDDLVSAVNEVKEAVGNAQNAGEVTVDTTTTTAGMAKSYTIKQGTKTVATIDIPKDMVVKSGAVETNPTGQAKGTYLVLTLANATEDKVYVNVGSLIDIYTAKASATQIQVAVDSTTREISATIVAGSVTATEIADAAIVTAKIADGNVTKTKLSKEVQASLDKADTALQEADVAELRKDVAANKASLAEGGATSEAIKDAKKAGTDAQSAVDTLTTRVETLESVNYVAITTEQIDAMFA